MNRDMPTPPDGDHIVSPEVFDHTAVLAFKNAGCAFAVCVDDDAGCIWISRRGRVPDQSVGIERALILAMIAAQGALSLYGNVGDGGGSISPAED